jgi:hypothetical protein
MTTLTSPLHGGDVPHHSNTIPSVGIDAPVVVGLVAQYEDVTSVLEAAKKVRDAGYKHWDVYSPFPIHGIDAAMGIKPTILPWLVLAGGLTGFTFGLVMTAWINGNEPNFPWPLNWVNFQGYPYLTSGKPIWSIPATIPVVFECTILFSALTTVFGMLLLNRLPMLYHPLFKLEMFRRATSDRFFIALDAGDPKFDHAGAKDLLQGTKPSTIETIED